MKIQIDKAKCIGCGTCVALAPDYFRLDEKTGKAVAQKEVEQKSQVEQAIVSCPVQAISLEESEK